MKRGHQLASTGHQLASTGHQLADYRKSASYSLNSRPQGRLFFYLSSNPD
nr:MAG TPA: hypothetical protein [Bacteriophage sp.]